MGPRWCFARQLGWSEPRPRETVSAGVPGHRVREALVYARGVPHFVVIVEGVADIDLAVAANLVDGFEKGFAEGTFLVVQVVASRQLRIGPLSTSVGLAMPDLD